jgi:hypothetical protein
LRERKNTNDDNKSTTQQSELEARGILTMSDSTNDYILDTFDHYRLHMKRRNTGNPAQLACILVIADLLYTWLTVDDQQKN